MERMVKKAKSVCMIVIIAAAVCMSMAGCAGKTENIELDTPEKAVQSTMQALKKIDLDAFNASTDNYVKTYRNFLGIPTRKEYRVFNELMQPGIKSRKRYQGNLEFAEKMTEDLSWEITDVRQQGDKAEVDMVITNRDMRDVIGNYLIYVLENMVQADGTGLKSMVGNLSDLEYDRGRLLTFMDEAEGSAATEVTVRVNKDGEDWKVHLGDSFISAFMGNFDAGEFSEEVEARLDELENEYEKKMDRWGDELGDKIEDWAEDFDLW